MTLYITEEMARSGKIVSMHIRKANIVVVHIVLRVRNDGRFNEYCFIACRQLFYRDTLKNLTNFEIEVMPPPGYNVDIYQYVTHTAQAREYLKNKFEGLLTPIVHKLYY
jgi:hypothetical protein